MASQHESLDWEESNRSMSKNTALLDRSGGTSTEKYKNGIGMHVESMAPAVSTLHSKQLASAVTFPESKDFF